MYPTPDSFEGFDPQRLRLLERTPPVPGYVALAEQCGASSLGLASALVVVWEQHGPGEASYLPPAPGFEVVLHCGAARMLEQVRMGQFSRAVHAQDELLIVPSHVPAYFRSYGPTHNLRVSILPAALDNMVAGEGTAEGTTTRLRNCFGESDPAVAALAAAAIQQLRGHKPVVRRVLDNIQDALVAHLIERYAERVERPRGCLSSVELRTLTDYAKAGLSEALTLRKLAALLGQSPYHFSRRFKSTTGQTPMRFVLDLRLQRAHDLLLNGSRSVLDIALETGFADGSHLSRWYRRKYGHPPTRARALRSG